MDTCKGVKKVWHASAPPQLKCFFLLAGPLLLTVEMDIQLLIFTQRQSDSCLSSLTTWFSSLLYHSLFCFPLFQSKLQSFSLSLSLSLLSAPGMSGSGTSGGVPDMGGSIYSKTQVSAFFFWSRFSLCGSLKLENLNTTMAHPLEYPSNLNLQPWTERLLYSSPC